MEQIYEQNTEENVKMNYQQAVEFVKNYMDSAGKKQAQIAVELGISSGQMSLFMSGNYKAPHTTIEKIENLASLSKQRKVAPESPAYRETEISRRVQQAIRYSHLMGNITVAYGDSGVGKTMAFRNYIENNTLAIGITISPSHSSIAGVNDLITEQLGIREKVARRQTREIVEKLKDSGRVIVVDEAQMLTTSAINHLRCISDESGVGICFIGNDRIHQLISESETSDYAQLYSRRGMKQELRVKDIKMEDVEKVFKGCADEHDVLEILLRISRTKFGMRGAVNVYINAVYHYGQITAAGLARMAREMDIR